MGNHHESGLSMNFARYQEIMRAQQNGFAMAENIHSVLNPGVKMFTSGGPSNTESFKQLINQVNPTWFPGSVVNVKSQRANDKI